MDYLISERMKRISYILLILIAFVVSGCTHNNGDIGPWFGTWKVVSIAPDQTYKGNYYWKFQSNVIEMMRNTDDLEYSSRYGTWEEKDGNLILDFTHHVSGEPSGSGAYMPFPELHISPGEITTLHIDKLSGSEIVLTYTADDGVTYTYTLKKWG